MPLVLSLFPGIGLLDMAFEQEGFCVVRGPDVIWGGDIRLFHPPAGHFDGVIGGPPCQMFSALAHMVRHNGHESKFGNLIPEFERCVSESQPQWFLMENVPKAPTPDVPGYELHSFILNNRQCFDDDGNPATQNRVRRISFGWRTGRKVLGIETAAFESAAFESAAFGDGRPTRREKRKLLYLDTATFESLEFEHAACGGAQGMGISQELSGDSEAAERARLRKRGIPIAIGGSGKVKPLKRKGSLNECVGGNVKSHSSFARLCKLQGAPADFLKDSPLTVVGKCKAVGNGVPLPMGRALAKAVKEAVQCP